MVNKSGIGLRQQKSFNLQMRLLQNNAILKLSTEKLLAICQKVVRQRLQIQSFDEGKLFEVKISEGQYVFLYLVSRGGYRTDAKCKMKRFVLIVNY